MSNWKTICQQHDLTANAGICVLHDSEQVAIFYNKLLEQVYAVSNYCPFGKANVLSRGMIGSVGDQVVVASPLYKQHFVLSDGKCLEDPSVVLKTYDIRIQDGDVQLAA